MAEALVETAGMLLELSAVLIMAIIGITIGSSIYKLILVVIL